MGTLGPKYLIYWYLDPLGKIVWKKFEVDEFGYLLGHTSGNLINVPPERGPTEDSKRSEHGTGTTYSGVPFSLGFGARRQSYSNFLASMVGF